MAVQTEKADAGKAEVVESLSRLLADTYTLYLKTQNYHWNVTGPHFQALHAMFEEQYVELRAAVDVIAERIRALGAPSPGSYAEFSAATGVKEQQGSPPEAMEMVRTLAGDHETVAASARRVVEVAEAAGDVATADLATDRLACHDKFAWMLRATAG